MSERERLGLVARASFWLAAAAIAMLLGGCRPVAGTKGCGAWHDMGNGSKCRACTESAECVMQLPRRQSTEYGGGR